MSERHAHLVGSLPGETPEQAMGLAVELLGPHLLTLPDGETGERRNWVVSIVEGLRDHPDLERATDGDWSDYDKTPRLRIRKGHRLFGASLDFGHVAAAQRSLPAFQQARAALSPRPLAYQAGVPGDFDLAMFTLGPSGALRHRRAFTEATLWEIRRVREITGEDTVFQIEVPAELVMVARAPAPGRAAAAAAMSRGIVALAAGSPEGTRFGIHLCLGDMNNKALGRMSDVAPIVTLANAIASRWPTGRSLEYVHAPFAAADQPAPLDPAFYAPLSSLQLPGGTRFAAGFAHESQDLPDQLQILDLIDSGVGHPVDIAAACGLGRRTPEAGRAVLERIAELCTH